MLTKSDPGFPWPCFTTVVAIAMLAAALWRYYQPADLFWTVFFVMPLTFGSVGMIAISLLGTLYLLLQRKISRSAALVSVSFLIVYGLEWLVLMHRSSQFKGSGAAGGF